MPAQGQMTFPFLEALDEMGGRATACDVYGALAEKVGLSQQAQTERDPAGYVYWHRTVRWVKQQLKKRDMIATPYFNVWDLSDKGKRELVNARPGVVITVFVTERGEAVWGEFAAVMAGIDDGIVNLHLTSPPYPLIREKSYGNVDVLDYVGWILPWARDAYRTLAWDGSLVLNLGEAYRKGEPSVSTYIERLVIALEDQIGFKLLGRSYWNNPSKLPAPATWVNIKRVRVKNTVEPIFWFGKQPHVKADNRKVLVPYSKAQQKVLENGWQKQHRPSGHGLTGDFAKDNGGAIPGNVLNIANTNSNDLYLRQCRENGLEPHPARFPIDLARWFIKFLTDEGDLVADLFGGSGTVAQAAEEMGRHWITGDKSLYYLRTAMFRFPDAEVNEPLLYAAGLGGKKVG